MYLKKKLLSTWKKCEMQRWGRWVPPQCTRIKRKILGFTQGDEDDFMVETWLLFIIELDLVMPTACQSSYFCVCVCVCSFYFNIYTFKVLSLCKFSINLVSCDELTLTMYIYIYQANFYFILFAFHFTSENHKI
jgi:hypothetical protein